MLNDCNNNSYIILGLTGAGKSSLCRVLSEDKSIEIGTNADSLINVIFKILIIL